MRRSYIDKMSLTSHAIRRQSSVGVSKVEVKCGHASGVSEPRGHHATGKEIHLYAYEANGRKCHRNKNFIHHECMESAKLILVSAAMTVVSASFGQQMAVDENHSKYILAVDEYVPAPGQFINVLPEYEEGDDAVAMTAKCTEAIANNSRGLVCLGAYGGYVTFHFDHSIANIDGQYDFYVAGNAISGGAEPGIVMVSKDENRNGLPDDPWYELSGSADVDSAGKVIYGYEITYVRNDLDDIPWTDNQRGTGTVDRNSFHTQEYFPEWLEEPLVFTGTLLPANGVNAGSGGRDYWSRSSLRYGYVDNVANTDSAGCSFDISWAVDGERNPVNLDFIDFVRVYTAVNQVCGWTGETSTEVSGAEDLHLDASISAIIATPSEVATFEEMQLDGDSYWNGSDKTGTQVNGEYGETAYANTFVSGSYRFHNTYNDTWNSWSGFAVSNKTSVAFIECDDQYNSAVGHGYGGSENYAVVCPHDECVEIMNKPDGDVISGFYVTNTANSIKVYEEGDGSAGKFETGDWCLLTVTGHHADSTTTSVDVYLADYRSSNETEHYSLDYWLWVDLSSLGKVKYLTFSMSSSRNNEYGMTTPGYFCMDNLNGEPDATSGIGRTAMHTGGAVSETGRYALDGTKLASPRRGVNIIKMSDGAVRKVFVK